jgi:hypothetical protein
LEEPDKGLSQPASAPPASTLLSLAGSGVMDKHREDDYLDFYYERNLPEMLSREGPHVASGDVNGDGLEDIYIGGAKGQEGQLYVQTGSGGFARKEEEVFKEYADFEDVAVVFFDADGDKDLDLFIGSGGNASQVHSRELQHRLYKNDGQGNFTIDTGAFGGNDMNISVAVSYDYDGDGDEDLFVGGRSVPYHYGETARSYVYNNDGHGKFRDVTETLNGDISKLGMVTAAVWGDVSGDERKELIVTGEWMATRVFSYNGKSKKLEELKQTGLEGLYGWWQCVAVADMNGDGKGDIIVGNVGENFYLRPDKTNPVKLWLNDFDNSGTRESFLTRTVGGRDMPVFLKREVTDQFPRLKKENLKHADYARKSVQELFGESLCASSEVKQFNYSSSVIGLNDGKGKFTIEKLPVMVQLSSVNAIWVGDINGDANPDLVLGGNMFLFPPQFGRLDGSYGHVVLNEGVGKLRWVEPKLSGLRERGEIKQISSLNTPDKHYLLITQNDQYPVLYLVKPR